MKYITVKQYAQMVGKSTTAIRKQIATGKLTTKKIKINGVDTTHILLEEGLQADNLINQPESVQVDTLEQTVQDAEIIKESPSYDLVSMKQTSFDELIQNIKELAEASNQSEKESYLRLEKEYFEMKQVANQLREEVEKYKIEAIQAQAELRIKEVEIKEKYEQNLKQLEVEVANLQQTSQAKETALKESQKILQELQQELKGIKEDHQKEVDSLTKQIEEFKQRKWWQRTII